MRGAVKTMTVTVGGNVIVRIAVLIVAVEHWRDALDERQQLWKLWTSVLLTVPSNVDGIGRGQWH